MSDPIAQPLVRVVCLSGASPFCSSRDLLDICHAYPDRKTQSCLGGKVLCVGEQMVLMLEGPRQAVGGLLKQIKKELPEAGMSVRTREFVASRAFTSWAIEDIYLDEVSRDDAAAGEQLTDLLIDLLAEETPQEQAMVEEPEAASADGETLEAIEEELDESEPPQNAFEAIAAILMRNETAYYRRRVVAA